MPSLQPLLILISHASSPPLAPPPDLKYDLRSAPNPPKAIRDKYTGLDKRLREHLLGEERFVEMLETAELEIGEVMGGVVERWSGDEGDGQDEVEEGEHEDEDEDEDRDGEGEEDRPTLRVGAFCAAGKHRSVAFVEELARRKWPWEVRVEHRDLGKSRRNDERKRRGQGKGLRYANGNDTE